MSENSTARKWLKVAGLNDLAEGRVKSVTCEHQTICLTHHEGSYGALDNRCPHQGGPLGGQARWMNVGDTWVPLEDISASRFCDGSAITAVANTTFIFGRGCVADIWILHLDR